MNDVVRLKFWSCPLLFLLLARPSNAFFLFVPPKSSFNKSSSISGRREKTEQRR